MLRRDHHVEISTHEGYGRSHENEHRHGVLDRHGGLKSDALFQHHGNHVGLLAQLRQVLFHDANGRNHALCISL